MESIPDLLTQNLQIPDESCSQYSLRSAGFEALLGHPVDAPSPGAAREDQGVWPPGALPPPGCALSTWTQNPCSHPQCQPPSWGPCPSLTGGQDTAVHGWEECGLSLNLKDRSALA